MLTTNFAIHQTITQNWFNCEWNGKHLDRSYI